MSLTVRVNGSLNGLVHKASNHLANSTAPDVCKTPSPGGPVPIPYPVIISLASDLANGTTTVKADGGKMIGVKGCEYATCTGDEPGTAGGVVSNTFKKEAKFILYSFDVKLDGKNACRLGDKMTMNHQNTVCLMGTIPTPVQVDNLEKELKRIAKKCNKVFETKHHRKKSCTERGRLKHKCCEDALKAKKAKDPKKYRFADPEFLVKAKGKHKACRLDVAIRNKAGEVIKIFDYKFNCKSKPKMSASQRRKYAARFKKAKIQLIGG